MQSYESEKSTVHSRRSTAMQQYYEPSVYRINHID